MACKRTAASDLNHDNWNHEDEPEESGTFAMASREILEKRIVRTAKRRLPTVAEGTTRSAFSGFSGFKALSTPTTSSFSFLSNTNFTSGSTAQTTSTLSSITPASNGINKAPENGLSSSAANIQEESKKSVDSSEKKNDTTSKKPSEYFAKLRGLNESVTQWIRTHVESNPFCLLTPIFRDYERYLKEIETQHGKETCESSTTEEKNNENTKSTEKNTSKLILDTNKPAIESKSKSDNVTPTIKSIFDKDNNAFGNKTNIGDNPFLKKARSIEFNSKPEDNGTKLETKSLTFPQSNSSTFSFGQSQTTNTSVTSAGFSFGGGKPFTFGANAIAPQNTESKNENGEKDDDDEPPKVEFKPVTEDGAIYEKRCKVFVKKDGVFGDRGIGVLFLKPTPNGKTQLIVRAENSLGNLLLNTLLTSSIPTKRMNEKTVMLVCLPLAESQPPPTPILLRVKTSEDADSLLEALESNKK
ncbi:hypothetical protein PV327_003174 [Microctonus hyperodae]|uniref:RanBD1 domain-containing protein n=1 Tax=Microctonus hyperodae TaxID=165561 RepID=A0AA39L0T4_MICHY|nr:hypothetical protein PV327_003174 [Microctonus hyperodae]